MNKHAAPPEFAMSFTQEAVLLEQRQGRDWRPLGQAYFAGREMAAKLHALRDEAGGASGDLDTILVIPDDQILYTTLTVPFGTDTAAIIGRALEGMTPYKAEELAFDWCPAENGEIETLRVAAVARRTLEEAEDFARAQGFHPAGFVARPGDNRFEGDPEFGPSRLAQEQLTRQPFSEPDLSQARVTDPVITDVVVPDEPAVVTEVAAPPASAVPPEVPAETVQTTAVSASQPVDQPALDMPVEPAKPVKAVPPLAAVTVSRIIAHHVNVQPTKPAQSKPDAIARLQAAVENVKAANSEATAEQAVIDEPLAVDTTAPAEDGDGDGRATGVIRHGGRKAPSTQGLSPRAQAVHSRAREAKALRAEQSEVEPAIAASSLLGRVQNLNPSRLTLMIGGLAVLVLAVLVFFGGRGDNVPVAQTDPVTEQVAATPAEQAPVQEGALDNTDAAEAEFADQNLPAAIPAEGQVAQSDAAVAPAETVDGSVPPVSPTDLATDQTAPTDATTDAQQQAAAMAATAPTAALAAPSVSASRPPAARPAQQPAAATQPERNAAQMALGNDTLSRALNDAIAARDAERAEAAAEAARQQTISAATMAGDLANAPTSRSQGQTTAPAATPRAAAAATTRQQQRLASSARPPRATPARATQTATDRQPTVPANPQPYAQRTQPEPNRLTGKRPPERPAAAPRRASAPAVTPAAAAPAPAVPAAATQPATRPAASSPRPPSRPDRQTMLEEGSANEIAAPTKLTADERLFLENLLHDLRTAQVGANGLTQAERGAVIRLADARPTRRPVSVGATSEQAVRDAVAAAVSEADRPTRRSDTDAPPQSPASAPSTSAGLGSSTRPMARPGNRNIASGNDPGPGNPSLSKAAVEDAIASAVASSPSQPGAVPLTALTSSAIPVRRPGGGRAAASAVADAVSLAATSSNSPTADDLRAAAEAQSADELAAQTRADEDLQRQAEERARQFAAADARAEAQARAAAEARARAQAEAEAANAARRQQSYQPPEAESEPEVASADLPDGRTPTTAGNAATVERGIQLNRTQIIGTIGAGRASRALVRLSNGRVLTLRIGDKINGGTISAIGDSRITYVRGGRQQQLSVLGGR